MSNIWAGAWTGIAVVAAVGSLVGHLASCTIQVDTKTAPESTASRLEAVDGIQPWPVKEFCYDGAVYLITTGGGITAKINPRHATGTNAGWSQSQFVECK